MMKVNKDLDAIVEDAKTVTRLCNRAYSRDEDFVNVSTGLLERLASYARVLVMITKEAEK